MYRRPAADEVTNPLKLSVGYTGLQVDHDASDSSRRRLEYVTFARKVLAYGNHSKARSFT
jgi:hypothetical protein